MKRILIVLLVALGLGAIAPSVAGAHVRALKGHCGMHVGKFLGKTGAGVPVYRLRIGPRMYHTGGTHRCHGFVHRRSTAADGRSVWTWHPFDLPNFRHFLAAAMVVNGTAASCVGFGVALAGEVPSGGLDTWLTASGAAGCATGVSYLTDQYVLSDGSRNGPVRLIK